MLKQQKEPVDDDYKIIASVDAPSVLTRYKNETSAENILNIQSKNDKTEVMLIDPSTEDFDPYVGPEQDA